MCMKAITCTDGWGGRNNQYPLGKNSNLRIEFVEEMPRTPPDKHKYRSTTPTPPEYLFLDLRMYM